MKKKSSKIIIGILLILVVLLGGFIIYDKVLVKDEVEKNNEKEEQSTTETIKKTLTKGQIDEYMNRVPFALEETEKTKDAYSAEKVTLENIEDEFIYGNVFKNTIKTNERPENGVDGFSNEHEQTINGIMVNECAKADAFKSNLKNMYNIENEIKEFYYPAGAVYKAGNYYCNVMGAGSTGILKIYEHVDYSFNNDTLVIREKAAFLFHDLSKQSLEIFKTTSKKELLGTESFETYDSTAYLNHTYIPKANTFKHTFKKNSNGEYYWYSTEIEK